MVEIMIVVAIIGVLAALAQPRLQRVFENQRGKSAVRSAADAFMLARSESIRSGNNVFVVMLDATGAGNPTPPELSQLSSVPITDPIVIVNDGLASAANCRIDAGEILHRFPAQQGVAWGTTTTLAGNTAAPLDQGSGTANLANGSSFTNVAVSNPASWVLFQPDGLPRLFPPLSGGGCAAIGQAGLGGGGIYVTTGTRDYAAVLSPLGTVRVHAWSSALGSWKQ
jgi:Tfp pilus assembly protein FimT